MKKTAVTLHDSTKPPLRPALELQDETEIMLARAVLRLNANILGVVLGIITGGAIFFATNFLILKGGPVVGPHLSLLSNFFPYYSVTFMGSIIGFGWGFVSGYLAGFVVASIYNLVVRLKSQ